MRGRRRFLTWGAALLGLSSVPSGVAAQPSATTAREFPQVSALLADRALSYAPAKGGQAVAAGEILLAEDGFRYRVAAPDATDQHLTTAGGVKLYALPVNGLHFTPEQLGYTDEAANWGDCAQKAWNAGYLLRCGPKVYLTSSTAYIRARTGAVGEGDRVTGVKAVDGFDGNIIDTENFGAVQAAAATEEAEGSLIQPVLRDFYIHGNRQNFGGEVSATNGIGVRLYCTMPAISNLRITYCAAHGLQTALDHVARPKAFNSLDHSRIGFVSGLTIMDCGYEGWVFQGPADIPCSRVYIGNNGQAATMGYDAFDRSASLVFPGETVDGLVLDNVGAEFANSHVWNHQNGRGVRIRTDKSKVRARFFNMISEGNWGQVHIESGARVEFYGEIHGNDGGPRNGGVFYDGGRAPFRIGQTVTGRRSGASGKITALKTYDPARGRLTVSFASDAAGETHFRDGEVITDTGGGEATVHRPDAVGAVPWWKDESTEGNLVSLKTFQVLKNDGSTMLWIGGANHVYTVQCQSGTNRYGHGIELTGANVSLRGFVEGRARRAASGEKSAGLIVRKGARRANLDMIIRSCAQNVLFEDASPDGFFGLTSEAPTEDHMNGLSVLDGAAYARARLLATKGAAVVWENRTYALADVDLTRTEPQDITLVHGQPLRPRPASFAAALSWKEGATITMPAVEQLSILASSPSTVTARLRLGPGGVGTARLAVHSVRA